jgi:sialate O-acetylesterase
MVSRRAFGLVMASVVGVFSLPAQADVKLPGIIGSNMVLQQGMPVPIWGRAEANEKVTVAIPGQTKSTTADNNGKWMVKLDPLKAQPNQKPITMTVSGKNKVELTNILIGEVWVCSGQSNMEFAVAGSRDGDLEVAAATDPTIRLVELPHVAAKEPQSDVSATWSECSPQTVGSITAVGYFFGRQLHETLSVPVGIIDTNWGGTPVESWTRTEVMKADPSLKGLFAQWDARVEKNPKDRMNSHYPANLYNGMIAPIIPLAVRGAIWYQGESNAGRAQQYRTLFPMMIENWRRDWGRDLSFYWVQLANFMARKPEPGESAWAELREAQSMTLKLPKTGEAVIIDIGEARNIHPKDKQDVGKRLARWALAKDYGMNIVYSGPRFKAMDVKGGKALITFDYSAGGLMSWDKAPVKGFAIAGKDKKWVWADAKVTGKDTVEVYSPDVKEPVAVRYGWADNPEVNLYNSALLPASPFRTDDWSMITAGKE